MHSHAMFFKKFMAVFGSLLLLCLSLMSIASRALATGPNSYIQHNLVSDGYVRSDHTDPNLVNAWGLVFNPRSDIWIADTGSGLSTLYNNSGKPESLVVKIPGGSPTGIVYNDSNAFTVSENGTSGASSFIFDSESGRISGWNYNVDSSHAFTMVNNGQKTGAIYKGLAIITTGDSAPRLYATDFHNGRIDVFDQHFRVVNLPAGAFTDPRLPKGFAPFGIQYIGGKLYVTYAKQDATKHDEIDGVGLGYIDVYNASGRLLHRLVSRGHLNAPWGMTESPADFGKFSRSLLVANFGDGTIDAYMITNGKFLGQLRMPNHTPVKIDGLWGICFGNGQHNQPTNTLFFTAGPDQEKHGLYGRIDLQALQRTERKNVNLPSSPDGY